MFSVVRIAVVALALLSTPIGGLAQTAPAAGPPLRAETARLLPVLARHAMVASQEAHATEIGVEVLKNGGNAVDAAVAVGFALAVTYPRAGNLGGGGFMIIHLADRHENLAIDYRETAPAAATPDMFLDGQGEADPHKSRDSGLGVGVPGTVAGLALAHAQYGSGKFTLAELIAPAIKLAREGFAVDDDLADSLPVAVPRLGRWPDSSKIFLKSDGTALGRGDRLLQSDLAASLQAIAERGPAGFYDGPLAEAIAASVRTAGGRMTANDLRNYRALMRTPIRGIYRGYEIVSMPPPSSGGVHLIEMLNILERYPLCDLGAESAATLHVMIEAMKRAYADRAEYLGDPDVVTIPLKGLISKSYAAGLAATIDPLHATPAEQIRAGQPADFEGDNTTHFSVVDASGNAVANTYTINLNYGLGLVAEGTGILLNDELDDFAAKPGAANAFGLTGSAANAPAAGKRPLSSMAPTIVMKDGRPVLVTGSPGGSRIITTVLQVISNVIDHGQTIAEAVAAPRIHHQWQPDVVVAERGLSRDTIRLLEERGHKIIAGAASGSANSILITDQGLTGAADPRTRGALAAGY